MIEVESLGEVGHVGTSPRVDGGLGEGVTLGSEPFLEEHDLAAVVSVLDVYVAAAGPRRDNVEWKAETRASVRVASRAIRILHPFTRCTTRGVEWHNVVSPATGLIVRDDENSILVRWRLSDNVHDLLLQPCTILWLVWLMLRQLGWANNV